MWNFLQGEAGGTFFLPSTVTFYEMKPSALLLHMRISILSLGVRMGERAVQPVVVEMKRLFQSKAVLKQPYSKCNEHCVALIVIVKIILAS